MLNRFWKKNNNINNDLGFSYFQEELRKQREMYPVASKALEEYRTMKMLEDLKNMLDFTEYEKLKGHKDTYYKYNYEFDFNCSSEKETDFDEDLDSVKELLGKIEFGFIGSHFFVIVSDEFEPAGCYMDIDENRIIVRLLYNRIDIKKVIEITDKNLKDDVTSAKIVTVLM